MFKLFEDKEIVLLVNALLLAAAATLVAGLLLFLLAHPSLFNTKEKVPDANKNSISKVQDPPPSSDQIENGLDLDTGLLAEGDYLLVKRNCTACHSSKLILQNRATKEGWSEMISWMQNSQKLWDLGESEEPILDYLAKHYGPIDKGRRSPAVIDEWYVIDN